MPDEGDSYATALGAVWRGDELLVAQLGPFEWDGEVCYRSAGGDVKFGESTAAAVVREFHEELDAAVEVVGFDGGVENHFTYAGSVDHDLVFVYEVAFEDEQRYEIESMTGVEEELDVTYETEWGTLGEFEARDAAFYPAGLRRLLESDRSRVPPNLDEPSPDVAMD